MNTAPLAAPLPRAWIAAALAAALVFVGVSVAAVRVLLRDGADLSAVMTAGGARPAGRVQVSLAGVTNSAGVGGDAVRGAAQDGIEAALGERSEVTTALAAGGAQRGARVMGPRGHVLDANIQAIRTAGESTHIEVSIVVSTAARAYEFEETTAVTLTGPGTSTPESIAAGVRRAMHTATLRAVDQMLNGGR